MPPHGPSASSPGTGSPGDEAIAVQLLESENDREVVHSLSNGLRDVIERHLALELVPALVLGYERTPCSQCRNQFVGALLALEALPAGLRVECQWDADQETRRLVGSGG